METGFAGNMGFVFMSLGDAYRQLGDITQMAANYERAGHLSPSPELQRFLKQLEQMSTGIPGLGTPDTVRRAPPPDTAKGATKGSIKKPGGGARGL